MVPGTQRTAAGVGDRAQARVPSATITHVTPRSLHSVHTVLAGSRGLRPISSASSIEQLPSVNGAAVQLVVDFDVRGYRRGSGQGVDVFGLGVDDRGELGDVGEVAQRLHAPAVAQAPMVISSLDWAESLGCVARRDGW